MPPVGFRPFHRGDIWRSQEKIFEEQGLVRFDILRIFKREDPYLMKISSDNFKHALEELGQLKFISFERKEPKPKSIRHVIGKIGGDSYANAVVAGKQLIKRIKQLQCVGNSTLSPTTIDLLKDVHLHPLRTGAALKWQMEFNKFSIVPHHEAIFARTAIRYFDEMIRQGWFSRHSEQSFLQFKRSLRFDCEPNRVDLKAAVEIYCENWNIKVSHAIPEFSTPGGSEPAGDMDMEPSSTAGGTSGSGTLGGTRMNGYATSGGKPEMMPGDTFGESQYDDGKWAEDICRGKPDGTNWEYSADRLFSLRSKFVQLPENILPTLLKLSPVFKLGFGYNYLCNHPLRDQVRAAPEAVQDVDISDIVIRPVRRPVRPPNAGHLSPSRPSDGILKAENGASLSAQGANSPPGFPAGEEANQNKPAEFKPPPAEEPTRSDQQFPKHNKPEENSAVGADHSAPNRPSSQPLAGKPPVNEQHREVIIQPVKKERVSERPPAANRPQDQHSKPPAAFSGDREEAQGVPAEDAVIRKNIEKITGERDSPQWDSRRSYAADERPDRKKKPAAPLNSDGFGYPSQRNNNNPRPQPRVKNSGPPSARGGGDGGAGRGGGGGYWWDAERGGGPNYGRSGDRYWDQQMGRPSFGSSRLGSEAGYDRRVRPEFEPPRRSPLLGPRYDHPPYPPHGRFGGPPDRYPRDEPPYEHFSEFSPRDRTERRRFRYPEDWHREDYYQEHFNHSPRGLSHGHEPRDLYAREIPPREPYYEHRGGGGWREEPRGGDPYRYPGPSQPKDDHRSQTHSSHRSREQDFMSNPHSGAGGVPPANRPSQVDHDWPPAQKNPNTAYPRQQTQSEEWARGRQRSPQRSPRHGSDDDWGPKQQVPTQGPGPASDTGADRDGDGGGGGGGDGDGMENASQNIKEQGGQKKPEENNRSYMECLLDFSSQN